MNFGGGGLASFSQQQPISVGQTGQSRLQASNGTLSNTAGYNAYNQSTGQPNAGVQGRYYDQNGSAQYRSNSNSQSIQQNPTLQTPQPTQNSSLLAKEQTSEFWQEQVRLAEISRRCSSPHHFAKYAGKSAPLNVTGLGNMRNMEDSVNHSRGNSNGLQIKDDPFSHSTVQDPGRRQSEVKSSDSDRNSSWSMLDLGGQSLKNVSPRIGTYSFLTQLYLCNNHLIHLPSEIGSLRQLTILDVSSNNLSSLPRELGKLTSLRELRLFDNSLITLPYELGNLYQLSVLGLDGNPLDISIREKIIEEGTTALIRTLRDTCPMGPSPTPREWILIDTKPKQMKDSISTADHDLTGSHDSLDKFTVLTYNILCNKYATAQQYAYTPSWALDGNYRRSLELEEMVSSNTDILCLQEIDQVNFEDFFSVELAYKDYRGVFYPKSRARTMSESEKKLVDGCAIFYRDSKFKMLDKVCLDITSVALQREDLQKSEDMFNRLMNKDNIAIVILLENQITGYRIAVANAHFHWDPQYSDVKLIQAALIMEELQKTTSRWVESPPKSKHEQQKDDAAIVGDRKYDDYWNPPTYTSTNQLPTVLCGDFNSTPVSGVYELIAKGKVRSNHEDFMHYQYGKYTKDGAAHNLSMKSAYSAINELRFTNLTPGFTGVIDYIWYNTNALQVSGVLGDVDPNYVDTIVGFPNGHFPSDHISLKSEMRIKSPGGPSNSTSFASTT